MKKNSPVLIIFIVLLFISLAVMLFKQSFLSNVISLMIKPLESMMYGISHPYSATDQIAIQKVINQQTMLSQISLLKKENSALRDQFAVSTLSQSILLPAKIIGMPEFIPGVSRPEQIILDVGESAGVHIGLPVVVKNILIGKVIKTTQVSSLVSLVTSNDFLFTAETQEGNALGIVRGSGGGKADLVNVELSDNLKVGDTVITKGDKNLQGIGLPPGLVVGKISAIDKTPSALYQAGSLWIPVDIARLTEVFVMKKY